jgi:hypothetical protein
MIIIEDLDEKKHGMNVLLEHLESKPDRIKKRLLSKEDIYAKVAILRFDIIDMCGKEHA